MIKDFLLNGTFFSLDNWQAIEVFGEDTQTFLNSQVTSNVVSLELKRFHWSTLLDISGKIVSYFLIFKTSSDHFYLVTPSELLDKTVQRLETYLFAEDIEIKPVEMKVSMALGPMIDKLNGYDGILFNLPARATFKSSESFNDTKVNDFWFLQGDPTLDTAEIINNLANNTYLDELAVNYKKGCFLGQETISKINSRRGAAYKFIILEIDTSQILLPGNIKLNNKKIGKIFSTKIINGKVFARAEINRENRLDNKKINFELNDITFNAKVHYAPFYKKKANDVAIDLYDEAIIKFQNDFEDEAITLLNQSISLNPSFDDAYESLGVIYGRQERFEDAIKVMEQLSELNPSSVMAHTNMSLYHMRLGNIETAEEHKSLATVKSFEQFGKDAENKKIAEQLKVKEQEELKQRENMFKQVLEIDIEDPLANYGMGNIELSRDNYFAAIKYLEKAIEADSKYSVAFLALSKAYKSSGQIDKAIEVLNKGIDVATSNGDMMPANEMQSLLIELS